MAAGPVITEFVASNSGGLRDEDGDSSDWIEIYNPTAADVDLGGWQLSDDDTGVDHWTFPATVLPAGEAVVVFASDKDRAVAGDELHTDFKLSSGGEYLSLRDDAGNVVSEFSPAFPAQATNISYGTPFVVESLIDDAAAGTFAVPGGAVSSSTPPSVWTATTYDDSSWTGTIGGVGYGVVTPGFEVTYVKAQPSGGFNGVVDSLADADAVLSTPAYQQTVAVESAATVNYLGTGGSQNFGGDDAFPTQSIGDDINQFVIRAVADVEIPSSGSYTFGVNSDDGFRLRLTGPGGTFTSQFDGQRAPADTLQTFNLSAGTYAAELVMFETAGGAGVEMFAASGSFSSFNNSMRLVGDVSGGGLAATHLGSGTNSVVDTDVSGAFIGNSSASSYLRLPFDVADAGALDALRLNARYNDGFVARINGVEVARRNAPASITSSSAATATRGDGETVTPETITLSTSSLVTGTNVLAVQLLNASPSDPSLLFDATLTGIGLDDSAGPSFFATPTPAAPNVDAVEGVLAPVAINGDAGFYDTPQTVTLSHPDAAATIRYTTDGSEPTATGGTVYSGPLNVSSTTVVRAAAFRTDWVSAPSVSRTYLFLDDVLTQSNNNQPPPGWPATWNTNEVDYGMDPNVINAEGATAVKDALRAIPTVSISTDLDNLFDPQIGIYSNARQDGRDWERPASAEWINPDGTPGFQINAGLRIRGGYSRNDFNPKHAFKLYFRGSYGESELNYPVHGDRGVSTFKQLDLRTAQNYSWSSARDPNNHFVTELLARRAQRELGQPYTRSTWFHLYLNGQYWGMFQTQERANADYAESYFGGDARDYDVVKPGDDFKRVEAVDGNTDAWNQLWSAAVARAADGITPAFVDDVNYLAVQGLDASGVDDPNLPVLVDVDNLIDYMMITIYGGNLDAPISDFILDNGRPNNFFGIRDRTGREGFRFFQHDAEHTFRDVNENRNGPYNNADYETSPNYFNPQWLHQQLMANDEYRLRFADAVQDAFFNEGTLSPEGVEALLDEAAAEIDTAVIAESARWGDGRWPTSSARTRQDWINSLNGLRTNYIPQRSSLVVDQFRGTELVLKDNAGNYNVAVDAPLYPGVDAPEFVVDGSAQHGGDVVAGASLTFAAGETVYYTTDGSDPRLFGGSVAQDASTYAVTTTDQTLLASGATWRYDFTGVEPASNWTSTGFNDSSWASGASELGFGDGDEATLIDGGNSGVRHNAAFFRNTFFLSTPSAADQTLTLRVKRDDGVAVYLNGTEIVRDNLPSGPLAIGTFASAAIFGDAEGDWIEFDVDPTLLVPGNNTIAARVHQVSDTSSDISFDAELILTTTNGGTPVTIVDPVLISARSRAADGTWSALQRATFNVPLTPASSNNLRVTELHYHPAEDPQTMTTPDTEFIELVNTSSERISLAGVNFTDGVTFAFGDEAFLEPGGVAVLVEDATAFAAAHPGVDVAGVYVGGLSNGGETVEIRDAAGGVIQSFTYDDNGTGWHPTTDGGGPSLTVVDVDGDYDSGVNWRPSYVVGGTPGVVEANASTVVGRHVAYGGATAAYGPDAIATDINVLLPGEESTAAHYTNYTRGLNRLIVDIDSIPGIPTAADVSLAAGAGFGTAVTPTAVDVVPGGGAGGSDRLRITIADGDAANTWLRVTLAASPATGLTEPDVFYVGNQIGEVSGVESGGNVRTNSFDTLLTRFNQSPGVNSAAVDNRYDINRDGRVNSFDTLLTRFNQLTSGGLVMFTAPGGPSMSPAAPDLASASGSDLASAPASDAAIRQLTDVASPVSAPVASIVSEDVSTEPQELTRREFRRAAFRRYRGLVRVIREDETLDRREARRAIRSLRADYRALVRGDGPRTLAAIEGLG